MDDDLEDVVIGSESDEPYSEERTALQIERRDRLLVDEALCSRLTVRITLQVDALDTTLPRPVDDLHRTAVVEHETCSQGVVPANDLAQRPFERLNVERAAEAQRP
jgi:hypothetical protein